MKKEDLFKAALKTRENSYSPYSQRKVGAAILTTDGKIFSGCNVENVSFGGTVCAERVAVQNAVAAQGKISIQEVVVVTDAHPPWTPCGFCRQVLAEFATAEVPVHSANLNGIQKSFTLGQLLPEAFHRTHLSK